MLRDLQRSFAAAVLDDRLEVTARIRPGRFPAEQHLQIYRHQVTDTLTAALASIYPVIEKLVDPGFFGYAAHKYLRGHYPRSANLHDFGDAFAEFLETFAPAASEPYLADVARLEWAWHRAFHAAEAVAFNPSSLAAVPADQQPFLHFVLHPSAHLVTSRYPIIHIFEVNQEGGPGPGDTTVDLNEGGISALVIRRGLAVCVESLAPGEAALLAGFQQRLTLAEALNEALAVEEEFDLGSVLADHTRRGTFVQGPAA